MSEQYENMGEGVFGVTIRGTNIKTNKKEEIEFTLGLDADYDLNEYRAQRISFILFPDLAVDKVKVKRIT